MLAQFNSLLCRLVIPYDIKILNNFGLGKDLLSDGTKHLQEWVLICWCITYRKVANIRRTVVGNRIVDHSDVVGASPVSAAPTTSSFST